MNKVGDLCPIHFRKQSRHRWHQSGSKYWWNQGLAGLIQGQIYNPGEYLLFWITWYMWRSRVLHEPTHLGLPDGIRRPQPLDAGWFRHDALPGNDGIFAGIRSLNTWWRWDMNCFKRPFYHFFLNLNIFEESFESAMKQIWITWQNPSLYIYIYCKWSSPHIDSRISTQPYHLGSQVAHGFGSQAGKIRDAVLFGHLGEQWKTGLDRGWKSYPVRQPVCRNLLLCMLYGDYI